MTKEHPLKGRKQSPEHVAKRIAARKANGTLSTPVHQAAMNNPEYKAQLGERTKKAWQDGAYVKRPGRKWTPEQKAAASVKRKQMWAEGRYADKKPATRRRVSRMERALAPYLEALGYTHNDEQQCYIGCDDKTRAPDFVDFEGRRVFEFFGNFWHHPDEEQHVVEQYRRKGWDCTVLWEADLEGWLEQHHTLVTPVQHEEATKAAKVPRAHRPRGNNRL